MAHAVSTAKAYVRCERTRLGLRGRKQSCRVRVQRCLKPRRCLTAREGHAVRRQCADTYRSADRTTLPAQQCVEPKRCLFTALRSVVRIGRIAAQRTGRSTVQRSTAQCSAGRTASSRARACAAAASTAASRAAHSCCSTSAADCSCTASCKHHTVTNNKPYSL